MGEEILSLIWALLVTVLILALAYWFTRHVVGRMAGGRFTGRQGRITVLDQVSLGKDQRLVVARVGRQVYLLGVTSGGISCLQVLSEEEAALWNEQPPPSNGSPQTGFAEALRKVWEQRKQ